MERTFLNFNTFLPPNQATKLLRTRFPCSPDPEEFCVCVNSDPRFQEAGTPSAGPLVPQLLAPLILPRSQALMAPHTCSPPHPATDRPRPARPGQASSTYAAQAPAGHALWEQSMTSCGLLDTRTLGLTSLVSHDLKGGDGSLLSIDVLFGLFHGVQFDT